jgi:hypothetical protein
MIFDMAEVETPSPLATSANASPCPFANPIAIRALTLLAALWRLPPFSSSLDTFSFLHIRAINSSIF